MMARDAGADLIKIFPAPVGGQNIKALKAPFPHVPFMRSGGVDQVTERFHPRELSRSASAAS